MPIDIQRADPRLRRRSPIVLALSTVAAIACVVTFHHWITQQAASLPTELLIAQLRRWIGIALTASGLCLLLLAGYAARLARRVIAARRWPLADARVLRDTPILREAAALRLGRWLNIVAIVLVVLAVAAGVLGWRLSMLT